MSDDVRPTFLSDQQNARLEAMQRVSRFVREVGFARGTKADPLDLIRLAEYVLTGRDIAAGEAGAA